jgi:hypothetical protein
MSTRTDGIAEGYLSACEQENRELRAENERLRADQRLLDESVRNQAIRETIHKEELKRLRAEVRECREALGIAEQLL